MRYTRIALCLLVATVVLGCQGAEPLTEAEVASAPLFSASSGWTEFEGSIDAVFFTPCANGGAGEDVHYLGTCAIKELVVETPSGGTHVNWQPTSCYDYTATGLETGDVYVPRNDSFGKMNWNSGESAVYIYREHFMMTNVATGERIDFPYFYHFTMNANGEVTVEVEVGETCRLHKN